VPDVGSLFSWGNTLWKMLEMAFASIQISKLSGRACPQTLWRLMPRALMPAISNQPSTSKLNDSPMKQRETPLNCSKLGSEFNNSVFAVHTKMIHMNGRV